MQLLRLWYHENCRVFRDRLVNEDDCTWFDQLLQTHMAQWEVAFQKVCPFQPILYGDFMSPGSDVKSYELITSESKVRASFPTTIASPQLLDHKVRTLGQKKGQLSSGTGGEPWPLPSLTFPPTIKWALLVGL